MNDIEKFEQERKERILSNANDKKFKDLSHQWTVRSMELKYAYNFSWMGRPVIQHPQDMIAMQELFWSVKPDLLIETGIAHGGSLIYYASLMELLGGKGHILGIDIDVRQHNRTEIEKHPMFKRITMFEGSSLDPEMVSNVAEFAKNYKTIMLALDSNHTHDHVLSELQLYTPFVTPGSYCVVFDTVVEDMSKGSYPDRPWDKGNNPKTAVWEFLKTNNDFEIDREIENKIIITVAPDGYLRKKQKRHE
jgi:cephalosporin hydroxylase